ncbi:MAG: GNAT family N-acetyltransferase [Actinobacteria bacterium]|jgi:predicted GNAT family N-acyltransferase|nr:GNAT family N-acetyltransferase [Actinomycetota bacterium]
MIRERRPDDLDPLCAILAALKLGADVMPDKDPRAWLEVDAAEQSWVYDMAPVHVAPTKNVVGHVQIYCPTVASSTPGLAPCARQPVSEMLAIGRLFVKPQAHDYGIARHLLKESRTYIQRQGKTAVLDLNANAYLTKDFCERYGFAELPSRDLAVSPMIYTGRSRAPTVSTRRGGRT